MTRNVISKKKFKKQEGTNPEERFIIISKRDIISALKVGEVRCGSFLGPSSPALDETLEGLPVEDCGVCAVGAVFRHIRALPAGERIAGPALADLLLRDYLSDHEGHCFNAMATRRDVDYWLDEGHYAKALSAHFEGVAKGDVEETIKFVKREFPNVPYRVRDLSEAATC